MRNLGFTNLVPSFTGFPDVATDFTGFSGSEL